MPPSKPVTAIFDIGKTNKKFLLFDENYAVLEKHQTELEQAVDDDGDPCEDLKKLEAWIKSQIETAQKNYKVQSLNFSGYGASLVHLRKGGEPVTPLYNYLKDYPNDLLAEFYESVGGKKEFSLQTASPPMGMLNSGLQLYWLKHRKPKLFSEIDASLHFPNYLSYLFTGENTSELTSIGCHTGLWDFEKMDYHQWVKEENILWLLPSPKPVSEITTIKNGINLGPGIHDSSAALAPYLIGMDEPFMLISTGTWSITLNPFNDEPLTYGELERDCLCYLDIFGNRVKAARFFLGAEYAHQKKKIERIFDVSLEGIPAEPEVSFLNGLTRKKNAELKLQLEKAYSSGPFPGNQEGDWPVHLYSSSKEAYHQLMLDLAAIQAEAIRLAEGSKKLEKIILTGGFSRNDFFIKLLASLLPDKKIYISKLSDASALGAAMVVNENTKNRWDGNSLQKLLGLQRISPIKGLKLNRYSWRS